MAICQSFLDDFPDVRCSIFPPPLSPSFPPSFPPYLAGHDAFESGLLAVIANGGASEEGHFLKEGEAWRQGGREAGRDGGKQRMKTWKGKRDRKGGREGGTHLPTELHHG